MSKKALLRIVLTNGKIVELKVPEDDAKEIQETATRVASIYGANGWFAQCGIYICLQEVTAIFYTTYTEPNEEDEDE